jgi:type II secretory pathway pseudopilin PulG
MRKMERQSGFSTLELLVVIMMSLIVSAIAIPNFTNVDNYLRAAGDLRALNGITVQAKMRAAADFTHARAYIDLAGNTYHVEIWNKTNSCWQTDGDAANTCTTANSPVIGLSQGVTFGTGGIGVGPTPGTTTTSEAPLCIKKVAGNPGGTGGTNPNTACIEFNSRGIPVDTTNAPVGGGAFYMGNQNTVDAITVNATGSIQSWLTTPSRHAASCWRGQ